MRKNFISFALAIPAAILIFFFVKCSSKSNGKEKGKDKDKGAAILPVNAIVIQYQEADNKIEVIGTILANEKVDLRSEIGGRVVGIFFKEGTKVRKGDKLVKIFDNDLRAQLRKIKLQQELATSELERKKKLLEIKGISQEEYDIASNQASTLSADVDLIDAQVRKTEIIAPFDGIIGLRFISEGEIVSPATPIATLQQIDPIKIEFDIPEKYGYHVKPGSTISFFITGDEKPHYGNVYATEPLIDVSTRTLKVRAHADNKGLTIRPGSFIKIDLLLEKNQKAMLIPSEAVVPGPQSQKVFVLQNGLAISRIVTTGTRSDRNIEIVKGISINDTVITSGIMQLKDSIQVNVKIIK
jgi:membrane fusion protein (multidrug efflux system)